ncbi:DNA (cytosine-5-)-methyltransferase [Marinilactibacillus psychrotolerans]|uniref:DNA (cytosine-5-)-methyltransferase n=1 Tax=Marinilactibacillus psychrotolerans TaxID=191770 RepID=UPI0038899265
MTFKVIETFSGIGAQAKAFEKLQKKKKFDYKVVATVEWEIGASFAYDLIQHGAQNLERYLSWSKEELINSLINLNLSSDGKIPMKKSTLTRMNIDQLRAIKHSIDENHNLVDISSVHAKDLPDADLLTYSFPCQDLSISSYWHGNFSGISKGVGNRSGLLWEIERILKEYEHIKKTKPRFLLMENVTAIRSSLNLENFQIWKEELGNMGYTNADFDIDSSNFGIAQSRVRTFMISVYTEDLTKIQKDQIQNKLNNTSFEIVKPSPKIDKFLRLDYSNSYYREEAILSTPNFTKSRKQIFEKSLPLTIAGKPNRNIARTITTKQDRYPNAGIILPGLNEDGSNAPYRNLTPRETFLLMGFEEKDFQILIDNNVNVSASRNFLSHSKLLKLAGNSIVVNILESIFSTILDLNQEVINKNDKVFSLKHRTLY